MSRFSILLPIAVAFLLGGCGAAQAERTAGEPTVPAGDSTPPATDVASVFPVTIEHKYGSTVIPEEPQRVLSLGFSEHDAILALGVEPIAVRYWFGDETDVIFPWAEEEAGDAAPEILNMAFGELNIERIAALNPDLILGIYSGITEEEYERLSQVAPTVTQSGEYVDFGEPWQEMTTTIGRAVGREARATELVAEVEASMAAAREAHPEWDGLDVAVATYASTDLGFFASEDPRSRFFRSLGFEVPDELDEIAAGAFFGTVSHERADLLDRDILVWDQMAYVEGGRQTIETDPIVGGLPAMEDGRVVYLEGDLENAFAFNSVLSLPYVLDNVVPLLEEAVPDPAGS